MNQPAFSIITPTFRRPQLLRRNIRSIRNQTFENYEHIIVDDANSGDTDIIIEGFADKRIHLIKHDAPQGAAASYNSGIKAAKGKYILFLDDDDEYFPCSLKKIYDRISASASNIGFIITGFERIADSNTGKHIKSSHIWPTKFTNKEEGLIAATSIGNGYGVCIKRECFEKIGYYDESITVGQDTEFLFRLAVHYNFETIPEILVKIHYHDLPQLTDTTNNMKRMEMREMFLKKNLDLLDKYPKLYCIHYQVLAGLCYRLKKRNKGRKIMLSIIRKDPGKVLNFTDLFTYEIFGMNTMDFYGSIRRKILG